MIFQFCAIFGGRKKYEQSYIYLLALDQQTYIGRCLCHRKTKSWPGSSHRFKEHIDSMRCHLNGTVSEKQRRSRYMLMANCSDISYPTMIVFDHTKAKDAAAVEATYINMFVPSCNNLQKTFGVRSNVDFKNHIKKLHKFGKSRQRAQTNVRIMSHFANSQYAKSLKPDVRRGAVSSYPEILALSSGKMSCRNDRPTGALPGGVSEVSIPSPGSGQP